MLLCSLCEERFSSNDGLREHLETHAPQFFQENGIKYEPDSDQYSDAGSLILDCVKEEEQMQGQQEATQGEVKSDESSLFRSEAGLEAGDERRTLRERESTSETFMCSECSFKTINKRMFKKHMNVMHLNKIKCDHCPKRFLSVGYLANHIEREHENEDKPKLPEDEFFRISKKQGNRKKWHECLKCMYKNHGRMHIYLHIRSVHREDLDELYKSKGMVMDDAAYHKCTKCFYKTLRMYKLKQHITAVHKMRRDFVCDLCKKAISTKSNLTTHMKNIHISAESSKLHKCSVCTYKTIRKDLLNKHLNSVHLKIRKFSCDLCQKQASTKDGLRKHIERHHLKKNILSCNRGSNCTLRTREKIEQLRHIRHVHEKGIKYEPDSDQYSDAGSLILDCVKEEEQLQGQQEETEGEVKSDESSLFRSEAGDEHRTLRKKESSSEVFMCSKCSFKTISKRMFKEHMCRIHLNKYKCEHCPKRFPSRGHLANHIRKKHVKDEVKPKLPEDEFFRIAKKKKKGNRNHRFYECLKCTFKTIGRSDMYRHIRGVHKNLLDELYKSKGMVLDDEAYHKCKECIFKTLRMYTLKKHVKRVHQKRRDFVCDLCKHTFSVKESIIEHMKKTHISAESLKLHKCSICTYKTTRKDLLNKHLNSVHLKIRKFSCDLCRKQSSTKNYLRQHIEKHHLEKNILSCNRGSNCSYGATNKHDLLRHIRRVHEKIQGASCEICGKWYSSRRGLNVHKKTQHLTKRVSITNRVTCDLCQFTTKNKRYMYWHMKRMHLK